MSSACHAENFSEFIAQLPEPEQQVASARSAPKSSRHREELIQALPWLADLDTLEGFSQVSASDTSKQSGSKSTSEATCSREEPDIDQIEAAFKALDAARSVLALSEPETATEDFKVAVLGGKWTLEHKNTAFDAVSGSARGALAKDFCFRRSMQQSMRFDVAAYGQDICNILARGFCHKMQWFLNHEVANPEYEGKGFLSNVVEAYQEPSELTKVASTSSSAALNNRVAQIRSLFAER
jgi:hypothetical protein